MSITQVPPLQSIPTKRQPTLLVIAAILIAVGGSAAAAAIGLIAVFGPAGKLDSGPHQMSTSAAALVTDVAHIQNTHSVGTFTGWPTVNVTASGGDPAGVFIGVGPAAAVENYLAGVGIDQITDLTLRPFDVTVARHPGSAAATPPGEQSFWVAAVTSRSVADLNWTVQDGDYRLVIMNADGAPSMLAQARVELTLPNAFPISLAVLGGGGLITAGGVAVLVLALSRRRRPTDSPFPA